MKHHFFSLILIMVWSCSKNNSVSDGQNNIEKPSVVSYDTTAVDSFGPGATSENVMAKINAVAIKRKQDSLAVIAKLEQEKLDKEKEEKEKAEKEKQSKELPKPSIKEPLEVPASTDQTPISNP